MNIPIVILLCIMAAIVLLLAIALFMPKSYRTCSEIIINAPKTIVFDYLKHIKNQDNYNRWVMTDPNMEKDFKGVDGTVGFVYAWNGNKEAGEGEQEITAINEGLHLKMVIRFKRPFTGLASAKMTTKEHQYEQTKVTWMTSSKMKYPINIMSPIIVKLLERDMAKSLLTLKGILEITAA